jgi:hypothetical protein
MAPPRIELGTPPRQRDVLPLNYGALIILEKSTILSLLLKIV